MEDLGYVEQLVQTSQPRQAATEMQTMFSGRKVDKAIETECEVQIKYIPEAAFGIIKKRGERNEELLEVVNYDWRCSGLFQLLNKQYEEQAKVNGNFMENTTASLKLWKSDVYY